MAKFLSLKGATAAYGKVWRELKREFTEDELYEQDYIWVSFGKGEYLMQLHRDEHADSSFFEVYYICSGQCLYITSHYLGETSVTWCKSDKSDEFATAAVTEGEHAADYDFNFIREIMSESRYEAERRYLAWVSKVQTSTRPAPVFTAEVVRIYDWQMQLAKRVRNCLDYDCV